MRMGYYLGYSDVYGVRLPIEEAIRKISSCPLFLVISGFSMIDDSLVDPGYTQYNASKNQSELLDIHVPFKQNFLIREAAQRAAEKYKELIGVDVDIVFFNRIQLSMAEEIAFRYCNFNQHEGGEIEDVIDALLIINDHIEKYELLQSDNFQLWAVNEFFFLQDKPSNYFYRWHEITKKAFSLSQNLRNAYERYFNMALEEYQHFGAFLWNYWHPAVREPKPQEFCFNRFKLQEKSNLPPAAFERILQQFYGTPRYFKETISEEELVNPFNAVTLRKKPLVHFIMEEYTPPVEKIFCLNHDFLFKKIVMGLYYDLIDLNLSKGPEFTLKTRSIFGRAFESYVLDIFEKIFASEQVKKTVRRFVRGDSDYFKGHKNRVDAIIDYGDSLILVECKSSLLPLSARVSTDPKECRKWHEENVVKGFEQIDKVIYQIRNNNILAKLGVNASEINWYYPLIITLQTLPTIARGYMEAIRIQLKEKNLLQGLHIQKVEIMNILDFETAEVVLNQGVSLKAMIDRKQTESVSENWTVFLSQFESVKATTFPSVSERAQQVLDSGKSIIDYSKE